MPAASVVARLERDIAAGLVLPDAAQRAAAVRLDTLADALAARPRWGLRLLRRAQPATPRSIYLWGGVGRGKTYLLDLFYASVGLPQRERTHFYRFMRDVHAELNRVRQQANPLQAVAASLAGRARLICLDEFFVADIADAMILGTLLQELFARGVTLVTTSNLPPRGLYPDGLQRQRFLPAIDMIERSMEVVCVDGPTDYRLRQLASAQTWHDAALPETAGRLGRLFTALAHGAGGGGADLQVGGRTIRAERIASGIAWFDFASLCRTPRSADDYIELAHLFPTVFLTDIPRLAPGDDDAARRLVMLVDEFYDRGVKLIVSAEAAPAALYGGERLRFDFERTSSRLVEMQSQQYLAREHRA